MAGSIPDHCLLWIDATGEDQGAAAELLDKVGLKSSAYAPVDADAKPLIELHRDSFHLRVAAITTVSGKDRQTFLDVVAARNIVLTIHPEEIAFLGEIDERLKRDTTLGEIDSAGFVCSPARWARHHVPGDRRRARGRGRPPRRGCPQAHGPARPADRPRPPPPSDRGRPAPPHGSPGGLRRDSPGRFRESLER